MAEVVEAEVGEPCSLTGAIEGVPDIRIPAPLGVMENPRHSPTGPESAEESPRCFILMGRWKANPSWI